MVSYDKHIFEGKTFGDIAARKGPMIVINATDMSYRTRLEARLSIFEYVEVFYNRQRSHSTLGYRSPEQYEKLPHET